MNLFSDQRRYLLITNMQKLENEGIDCFSCQGSCCTFVANSMQVTPLEALELYLYLQEQNRWDLQLIEQLQDCIQRYRLNIEIQTHRHQQMRKTYTCPFYRAGGKGCSISRKVKPYGCLGFNPQRVNCQGDGGCLSDIPLLQVREEKWGKYEDQANQLVKDYLDLSWLKLDISRALLDISQVDLSDSQFFADVSHLLEQ